MCVFAARGRCPESAVGRALLQAEGFARAQNDESGAGAYSSLRGKQASIFAQER